MHNLESPRARYKFNVETGEPCAECLFFEPAPFGVSGGSCVQHDIVISGPARSTCQVWINGVPCDEHPEEERFHIEKKCPWCDYVNDIDGVSDCQFVAWSDALERLLGIHLMIEHAEHFSRIMDVFTGAFPAFARLAVDAASKIGRLADFGRRAGRTVGNLQRKADRVGK